MFACVVLGVLCGISECVTVHRHSIEPDTKNREELSPLLISCKLNDIVTITAPFSYKSGTSYYLHSPGGDVTRLNITHPTHDHGVKKSKTKDKFKVTNVNSLKKNDTSVDLFSEGDDFVIGPLTEEDHGNWVLSVYEKKKEWVEWFQVITIEIVEAVPIKPALPELNLGDTLELSFAYPIQHLQSCQLTAPLTTYDRFYERATGDTCAFIVRNITAADGGAWNITGVGRIVYTAETILKVKNKIT